MQVIHADFGRIRQRRAGSSEDDPPASVTSIEKMRIKRLHSQWFRDHGVSEAMRRRFESMTDEHQRAARDFVDRMVTLLSKHRSLLACQAAVDIRDDPGTFQAGHRSCGHQEPTPLAHLRTFLHMQTPLKLQAVRSNHEALVIARFISEASEAIRNASIGMVVNYGSITQETRDPVLRIADEVIMSLLRKWAYEDLQTPVGKSEG